MNGVYSFRVELMKLDKERSSQYATISINTDDFLPISIIHAILDVDWQNTYVRKLEHLQENVVTVVEFTVTKDVAGIVLNDVNIIHVYRG